MGNEKEETTKPATINFGEMNMGQRLTWASKAIFGLKETSPAGSIPSRDEDFGFRRLSQRSDKELKPADWQKQLSVAHFLWLQNPMAGRILELQADFVVGDGYTWEAVDDEVRKVLAKHWEDPDNNWEQLQFERYQELSLFGTWAPRVFVAKQTGHVKLGPIDPSWISDIIPDKDIAGKAVALRIAPKHLQSATADGPGEDSLGTLYRVVALDERLTIEDPVTKKMVPNKAHDLLDGEIFYFTINKLTFLIQGLSDIFRTADWLDAFDQFIFSLLERINFLNAHLYDITLEGAEQKEVNQRASELALNPPKPGSSRVHNEKETWQALAPKINAAEVEQVAKIIKMLILGSHGIPEHWFGEGGDTNRATAAEMGGPIHRKLKRKQAQWSAILRTILQFQIDQAIKAGRLSKFHPQGAKDAEGNDIGGKPRDLSFTIMAPEVSSKRLGEFVDSLDKLTSALAGAIAEGFVGKAKAAGIWTSVAQELGVDIEAPDEAEIEKNQAERDADAQAKVAANQEEAITPKPPAAPAATNGHAKPVPAPEEKPAPTP